MNNRHPQDLGTAEGLRAWRDLVIAQARNDEGQGGCPLGSLAGQLAETDPRARAPRPLETAVDTLLQLAEAAGPRSRYEPAHAEPKPGPN
jgi:hypothetical protein